MRPISRVFIHINKKTIYNLYHLIYLFAGAIGLRIIGRIIKELDPKLIEEYYPKLIKELWVMVSD